MIEYNTLVESNFFSPKHVGTLDSSDSRTRCYQGGHVQGKNYFKLYLQVGENDYICKARFQAYGSPYLIAGVEWLCQHLEGKCIVNFTPLYYDFFMSLLNLPKTHQSVALMLEEGYKQAFDLFGE